MSFRNTWPYLAVIALSGWLGASAMAQGVVPGGWAPQFSYQTFSGPGAVGFGGGSYFGFGYGVPGTGLAAPGVGVGGFAPYGPTAGPPILGLTPSSQAVNGLNPLIGTIRRSTGRRGK